MTVSSLPQSVVRAAMRYPEKDAIRIEGSALTYHELLCAASQVANILKDQGANKEAIGIVGQRHMASYVGVLGVLLAGCYYVPINPKLSEDKVVSIIIYIRMVLLNFTHVCMKQLIIFWSKISVIFCFK